MRMPFTTLKMAVVDPMPSAKVRTAAAVNPGLRRRPRSASRKSALIPSSHVFIPRLSLFLDRPNSTPILHKRSTTLVTYSQPTDSQPERRASESMSSKTRSISSAWRDRKRPGRSRRRER